jgi:hypothetical protein
MVKLEKIYFDGKGYLERCIELGEMPSDDLIRVCSRFNFTPVDSITFKQSYCDIRIDDYYIKTVSLEHLYTSIEKKIKTVLYPSHNPTPNPGGLY